MIFFCLQNPDKGDEEEEDSEEEDGKFLLISLKKKLNWFSNGAYVQWGQVK